MKTVGSVSEFQELINTPGKLVVVDYFASWCGPCRKIAPFFEELSGRYPDVLFLKVQQDGEGGDICRMAGISAFPTFKFYINGTEKMELKGASPQKLEEAINFQHALAVLPPSVFVCAVVLGVVGAAAVASLLLIRHHRR